MSEWHDKLEGYNDKTALWSWEMDNLLNDNDTLARSGRKLINLTTKRYLDATTEFRKVTDLDNLQSELAILREMGERSTSCT